MLYEWHDIISQSVRMSFHTAANAMTFGGGLLKIFNMKAQPDYRALTNTFRKLSHDQPQPSFGLWRTKIDGQLVPVTEEVVVDKPFGRLLHFKCNSERNVPKIMIVAPISGHKATILRDTVRELIPDSDVYVTDWKDAREVPLKEGKFDLDEYMAYVQDFIHEIGPNTHLVGISQSTVPVLAVTALLSARKDSCQPLSMTLMCGPIDPRINETDISRLSRQRDIDWFRKNMIMRVPENYAGRGRNVFPGFMQSMGLLMAAPNQRHHTPAGIIGKLYGGQGEKLDTDAPYYLDTIQQVFLEHRLPRGTMTWHGEKIDLSKISNTALFTVEGTHDNMTAPGQTSVAHLLCDQIDPKMKRHHLQPGAGHTDLFSGVHWKSKISIEIKDFIRKIAATHGIAYDPLQVDTPVKTAQNQLAKPALAA